MDPSGGRDSRYNLNYSMSIGLSMSESPDMYGGGNNQNSSLRGASLSGSGGGGGGQVSMNRGLMGQMTHCGGGNGGGGGVGNNNVMPIAGGGGRGIKRSSSGCFDERVSMGSQVLSSLDGGGGGGVSGVTDVVDDSYTTSLQKKSPPANGKKTKGRVKIKMEYIDNKLRRYTTFSKRKTGIMKKVC